MNDFRDLKAIAEACQQHQPLRFMPSHGALYIRNDNGIVFDVHQNRSFPDFMAQNKDYADFVLAAKPAMVLALIAENERLTGFVAHRRAQANQYDEALIRIADQRDQFKAENEVLRKDAERYRFLRSVDSDYAIYTPGQSWEDMTEGHLDAQVDESIAIDAAMRKEAN